MMITTMTMLAALATGQAGLQPGSYHYNATHNGAVVGSSTLAVSADNGGTRIEETASGATGGLQMSATATMTLGPDLAPTAYDGSYTVAGQKASVNVALSPGTATVNNSQSGGKPQTFSPKAGATHFVVIEPGLLAGLFALPAQLKAWNDVPVTLLAPALGREDALTPSTASQTRPPNVPANDVSLSVDGQYPFVMWYDPATLVTDEIDVPSENATITRVRV